MWRQSPVKTVTRQSTFPFTVSRSQLALVVILYFSTALLMLKKTLRSVSLLTSSASKLSQVFLTEVFNPANLNIKVKFRMLPKIWRFWILKIQETLTGFHFYHFISKSSLSSPAFYHSCLAPLQANLLEQWQDLVAGYVELLEVHRPWCLWCRFLGK